MTGPTATQFEESSERLRRSAAERDETLEAVDADYTKALAAGAAGDIYTQYLDERQSVINSFQLEATSIGKDYSHKAPPSSPPLPTPPAPSAACPPPPVAITPVDADNHAEQQTERRGNGPSRTSKVLGMVIGACILALVTVITISAIASTNNTARTSSSSSDSSISSRYLSSTRTVLYEVEGTARSVNITYQDSTGSAQQNNLQVPLITEATSERGMTISMNRGDFVYLSAQNQGSSGTVTCRITVDGVVISTVTSRGGYTIATCKGTAP